MNSCVRLSEADVNAGKLRFVPAENETGFNGYGGTGLGNMAHDYASFTYTGYDGKVESDPVTMTVDVIPVATAPTLSISQQVTNVQLDVVRTNWESVPNPDTNATLVNQSTLEGWTAVGTSGFTVWSDQDVHNGARWHQLHAEQWLVPGCELPAARWKYRHLAHGQYSRWDAVLTDLRFCQSAPNKHRISDAVC